MIRGVEASYRAEFFPASHDANKRLHLYYSYTRVLFLALKNSRLSQGLPPGKIAPIYEIVLKQRSHSVLIVTKFNKLARPNYAKLSAELIQHIRSIEPSEVAKSVKIMVKKAMIERKYRGIYADLARDGIKVLGAGKCFDTEFRRACRETFAEFVATSDNADEIARKDLVGFLEFLAICCDSQHQIFQTGIMIKCAAELLQHWNECTAEALCSLLNVAGAAIASTNGEYTRYLLKSLQTKLIAKEFFSTRIKFLIEQTLALPQNKWKPADAGRQVATKAQTVATKPRSNQLGNIQTRVSDLLGEFRMNRDMREVDATFADFARYTNLPEIQKETVQQILNSMVEQSTLENAQELADFSRSLVLKKHVPVATFQVQIAELQTMRDDLIIDIPRIDDIFQKMELILER